MKELAGSSKDRILENLEFLESFEYLTEYYCSISAKYFYKMTSNRPWKLESPFPCNANISDTWNF